MLDLLKFFGGFGIIAGAVIAGLFGLSKFRNSGLRSKFEKIVEGVGADKDKIHEIEVSIGKDEQKKQDLQDRQETIEKQLDSLDKEKPKVSNNDAILNMFDKLSNK